MTYKVIAFFTDLRDGGRAYNVGDVYPRPGLSVTKERLAELSGTANRRRMPLIAPVPDEAPAAEGAKAAKRTRRK